MDDYQRETFYESYTTDPLYILKSLRSLAVKGVGWSMGVWEVNGAMVVNTLSILLVLFVLVGFFLFCFRWSLARCNREQTKKQQTWFSPQTIDHSSVAAATSIRVPRRFVYSQNSSNCNLSRSSSSCSSPLNNHLQSSPCVDINNNVNNDNRPNNG